MRRRSWSGGAAFAALAHPDLQSKLKGAGWRVSTGQDIGLSIDRDGGEVVFLGPSGFRAVFTEDGDDWESPSGMNATLTETGDGWELTYHRSAQTLKFAPRGWLLAQSERNGNELSFRHDEAAGMEAITITDAAGRDSQIFYVDRQLTQINDFTTNRLWTYDYNSAGQMTSSHTPDGVATEYDYDSDGRLGAITTAEGAGLQVDYDNAGRVTEIREVDSSGLGTTVLASTGFVYTEDGDGPLTLITDPGGHETRVRIDDSDRVDAVRDPLGRERSQTWTPNSAPETMTDAVAAGGGPGNVTEFAYDEANNPSQISLPTGAAAQATYTAGGECGSTTEGHPYQVKCATDPSGNTSIFDYDDAGNLLSFRSDSDVEGGALEIAYTYQGTDGVDCGGYPGQQCSAINGEGAETSFSYDDDGNMIRIVHPDPLGETNYTFDSIGRLESVTDAAGRTSTYEYDVMDRLTRQSFEDGRQVVNVYDDNGRRQESWALVETSVDNLQVREEWEYDSRGQITSYGVASDVYTASTAMAYDSRGNLTEFSDAYGTTNYSYDAASQLRGLALPGADCGEREAPGCIRFAYDRNGNETSRSLPGGGAVTREFDESSRLTAVLVNGDLRSAAPGYEYSYGAGDRDTMQVQSMRRIGVPAAPPGERTTRYSYDTLGRLVEATDTTSDGETHAPQWGFGYDNAGNRTEVTQGSATTEYSFNDADQIVAIGGEPTEAEYTATGDMSRTPAGLELEYNDAGQLAGGTTENGDTFENTYAGSTNATRLVHTVETPEGVREQTFQPTPLGHTVTTDSDGDDQVVIRHPDGSVVATLNRETGEARYLATDLIGSPLAEIDDDGSVVEYYQFSPYGDAGGLTTPAYAGGQNDPTTGLVKFGARYYSPTLGIFTQMDPSGIETNPYLYAAGDPINFVDPTGLSSFNCNYYENVAPILGLISAATTVASIIMLFTGVGIPLGIALGMVGLISGLTSGYMLQYQIDNY